MPPVVGRSRPVFDEDAPAIRQQLDLIELEGLGDYDSLQGRGLVNEQGHLTERGRAVAGPPDATTAAEVPGRRE